MKNKNVTFIVHGINCADNGADTVMQIAPHAEEFSEVINHCYGWIGPIGAIFKNKKIARKLVSAVELHRISHDGNYVIGHSNGCAIVVEALRQGARFKSVLLINPALNVSTVFPPGDYTVTVVHTKHDKAVKAARFFDFVPVIELIIPDIWGAMGARGYTGRDPRITNLDWSDILESHTHIFDEKIMGAVGPVLAGILYDV